MKSFHAKTLYKIVAKIILIKEVAFDFYATVIMAGFQSFCLDEPTWPSNGRGLMSRCAVLPTLVHRSDFVETKLSLCCIYKPLR